MFERTCQILLLVLIGALVPIQILINSSAARVLGHPLQATAVAYFVGGIAAMLACGWNRLPMPSVSAVFSAPVWLLSAGLLGVVYIATVTAIAPRVGAFLVLTAPALGQMISGLLLDHLGAAGTDVRTISGRRLVGLLLMGGGLFLAASKNES